MDLQRLQPGRCEDQVLAETNNNVEEKHTDFYDASLVLLDPYARKAINNKYPTRSYGLWNGEILEVNRKSGGFSQYDFMMKIKYDTFTGPHNPPEGPVTLTFNVQFFIHSNSRKKSANFIEKALYNNGISFYEGG